ncbi:MAG: hypothetical protein KAV82_11350 [Phycisphaerae bacterium]|nr:hypothetical protein [Phycisphaerae bacterium]
MHHGLTPVAKDPRPSGAIRPPEVSCTRPVELSFLLVDTRTPYVVDYLGEDGGKTAHYILRWVATTGEKGPPAIDGPLRTKSAVAQRRGLAACQGWSETASATIGA